MRIMKKIYEKQGQLDELGVKLLHPEFTATQKGEIETLMGKVRGEIRGLEGTLMSDAKQKFRYIIGHSKEEI